MNKPIVALVGRPNVGKSTLFNRLAGERLSIVDDTPGTTRDRLFSQSEWNGKEFYIVDTGGFDPTFHDSQTPLSIGSADYILQIRSQVEIAIEESQVVLFLVDAQAGVTPADFEVAQLLRSKQHKVGEQLIPPIFLVVNKADNAELRDRAFEFYELGLGDPYPISGYHGTNTGDLLDALVGAFPPTEEEVEDESVKIAIVGKPNVGKSSLLNRLVGEERSIVSPIAGTTRDSVDTPIIFDGLPVTLIDTAGIRRRGKIDRGVEQFSVVRAMHSIERADVCLLLLDAELGITVQDTHIAGFILEAQKSVVVVVNKWDLVVKDSDTMDEYTRSIREALNFMDYVPLIFISAKTGQRVDQVMPLGLRVQEERLARMSTSQLNKILHDAQDAHQATSRSGNVLRLYYGTQVRSDPPTFMIYVNNPKFAHFSYLRYLENSIRAQYPFIGTPIRLVLKPRQ